MKTEQTPEERYREREELKKTLIRKVRQLCFTMSVTYILFLRHWIHDQEVAGFTPGP